MPTIRERITGFFRRLFRREIEEPVEIVTPEPIVEERLEPILPEPEEELIAEAPPVKEEIPILEEREMVKLVTFSERIRDTRIRRIIIRSFPVEMSDEEIQKALSRQYDEGGNFVMQVKSISIGEFTQQEQEIERGMPGSADRYE